MLARLFSTLAIEGQDWSSIHHMTIETHHSLYHPMDAALQYWTIGGATVSATSFVRLTPAAHSRSGWLLNNNPIRSDDWEMDVTISIRSENSLGGDGFGIWVLNRTMFEKTGNEKIRLDGDVLGMVNNFNGFGVIIDTYDNDNDGKNPMVMVFWNDGSKKMWDHDKDFIDDALGDKRCTLNSLKNEQYLRLILIYQFGTLNVYKSDPNHKGHKFCLSVELNNKTKDTHVFAFTAMTGAVADVHEIKAVSVQYLDKDSPVADSWSMDRQGVYTSTIWKTRLHWIICAISGTYICWLSSQEYFLFEQNVKGNTSILCSKINNSRKVSSMLSILLFI